MYAAELHRMKLYRAILRHGSCSTTSTNRRYIKRLELWNFFPVQCINVKEVVWGPVETSDTRVVERSEVDSYLSSLLFVGSRGT